MNCFNSHFFEHNALGMRSATERISLPAGAEMCLLVVLVVPSLTAAIVLILAGCADTARLTCNNKFKIFLGILRIL
jgi:hypothetical protein